MVVESSHVGNDVVGKGGKVPTGNIPTCKYNIFVIG